MLLAGDIGGTKTVLALFAERGQAFAREPLREETFPSSSYSSLEAIIADFLGDATLQLNGASFGVAGPVVQGRARITNLPWVIEEKSIEAQFGVPTTLLNDLEAIANAVPHLHTADLFTLHHGQPSPTGAIAVIAPGTGLGEAYLVWVNGRYESFPSEGGHASFAPTSPEQLEVLAYLLTQFNHVSYERICSGMGIPTLYAALRAVGRYPEPAWLRDRLDEARDQTPIIFSAALQEEPVPLCRATLDMFIEILGNEAANLALKVLATGGIYIGGGIPPRILPQLEAGRFLELFQRKGRFSQMMAKIPVHVIRNPKVALYGAAYEALRAVRSG